MRNLLILLTIISISSCSLVQPKQQKLDQDFQRFLSWFGGEYNNHEQVWQETIDKPEQRKEHIHHIFKPVNTPTIGDHTFFVKQYMDDDPSKVYRQRLYQFTQNMDRQAIQLTIYRFKDEARYSTADQDSDILKSLTKEDLISTPGCEVYWTYNGEYFDGFMDDKSCFYFSKRLNKNIYISDTLRLTDSDIWIADQAEDENGNYVFGAKDGVPHKNRKVTYYTGWAGFEKKHFDLNANEDDWVFMRDIRIHNEGQRITLLDKAGNPSGVDIQLAKLTYQNTTTPILVLKFFKTGESKSFSYSWAETESGRVGINLRYAQAGLTREK